MCNRVDFYQSAASRLALPAASVSVEVDGSLSAVLEPVEIVRSGWPEFGWARLACNPAAYAGGRLRAVEEIAGEFAMGASVRIEHYYNGTAPRPGVSGLPIFCGHVERIETTLGPEGPLVEITARDFSAHLERITVYGRRVARAEDGTVFLAGLDTVFNPDGLPNAYPVPVRHGGRSYTVFCADDSGGRPWRYAEVIDYLLGEYLSGRQLQRPSLERLEALTEGLVVRDLDVTGLSVLEALHRCCERLGLRFKLVPALVPTGPAEAMVFYRAGAGRAVELNCQPAGRQLSISGTNVAQLHSRRSFQPVTHKYIGQGDFKVFEATFDLVKAWDPNLEDTVYDTFSPSTNPHFYRVKDVYRKWCLNEAGDYAGQPYNQGDAFDFSKIFGTEDYAPRRRRFRPALTADKQGKSLGYFLEVSYDGGDNWWQYLHAFNILLDECGVWLSSDRLDMNTWVAALKGLLKFRITASVVGDERLWCTVADGPVNSTAPVIEQVITLPRRFKYRKVSSNSIFANGSDEGLGAADQVDDTEALYEYIRHVANASGRVIETIDVQTPFVLLNYELGDRVVASPESRDLFSTRTDNRSVSWIERVRMDFREQRTDLRIIRRRGRRL